MFSALTSKIFGGLAIALAVLLAVTVIDKNSAIGGLEKELRDEKAAHSLAVNDYLIAVSNGVKLEAGLTQCNSSISAMKSTADALTKAGVVAVQQVQQAGRKALSDKLAGTEAMPKETCEDAFKILKSN